MWGRVCGSGRHVYPLSPGHRTERPDKKKRVSEKREHEKKEKGVAPLIGAASESGFHMTSKSVHFYFTPKGEHA